MVLLRDLERDWGLGGHTLQSLLRPFHWFGQPDCNEAFFERRNLSPEVRREFVLGEEVALLTPANEIEVPQAYLLAPERQSGGVFRVEYVRLDEFGQVARIEPVGAHPGYPAGYSERKR